MKKSVKEKANAFLIVMWLIRAIAKYWQDERAFSLQGECKHAFTACKEASLLHGSHDDVSLPCFGQHWDTSRCPAIGQCSVMTLL